MHGKIVPISSRRRIILQNLRTFFIVQAVLLVVLAAAFATAYRVGVDMFYFESRVSELESLIVLYETPPPPEPEDHQGGVEINLDDMPLPIHPDDIIDYSSPFGPRRSPFTGEIVHHPGLDLYGVWHARIVTVGSGVVTEHLIPPGQRTGFSGHEVFGGCLVIEMDTGEIVTFGHLSETYVNEGSRVRAGEVIGRQGSTGQSTGEHLHFQVVVEGKTENPFVYLLSLIPPVAAKGLPTVANSGPPRARNRSGTTSPLALNERFLLN